jgi:hypothetical protein
MKHGTQDLPVPAVARRSSLRSEFMNTQSVIRCARDEAASFEARKHRLRGGHWPAITQVVGDFQSLISEDRRTETAPGTTKGDRSIF